MKHLGQLVTSMGLSLDRLAEQSGMGISRLRDIVDGKVDASLRELNLIASALNLSVTELSGLAANNEIDFLFRNNSEGRSDLKQVSQILARRISTATEILGSQSKPQWLSAFGVIEESASEAMRLASLFRYFFCGDEPLRPIPDLPQIIVRANDIILLVVNKMRIDGASGIHDGWPFIYLSKRFPPRMLFTLAHELAHIVSHHNESEAVFVDAEGTVGRLRHQDKVSESFADFFASNLLLPEQGVGKFLGELRQQLGIKNGPLGDVEILHLAHFFCVSFEVAAIRCEQLNLLPSGGASSLSRYLKKEHGSPEKRAQELGLPSRDEVDFDVVHPALASRALKAIEQGEVSLGLAADMLGMSAADLIRLNSDRLH